MEEKDWIFTFCNDHQYPNSYVKIHGDFRHAREEMFVRFGSKWAFQYESEKEAGVEKYGLIELQGKQK